LPPQQFAEFTINGMPADDARGQWQYDWGAIRGTKDNPGGGLPSTGTMDWFDQPGTRPENADLAFVQKGIIFVGVACQSIKNPRVFLVGLLDATAFYFEISHDAGGKNVKVRLVDNAQAVTADVQKELIANGNWIRVMGQSREGAGAQGVLKP